MMLLSLSLAALLVKSGCSPIVARFDLNQIEPNFETAELQFHDVRHTRDSFAVRVFLNQPNANASTPIEDNDRFSGSLYFYGQGEYIDATGNKLSAREPIAREFDLSTGASNTSPFTLYLDITDSLRKVVQTHSEVTVSMVSVDMSGNPIEESEFDFRSITLETH